MKARLVTNHSPHCIWAAGEAEGPQEWSIERRLVFRDAIGRKNGTSYMWRTAICNDPDCPAEVIFRDVSEDIEAALRGGDPA